MASLTVVAPGLLTSVQDLGRWGHQALGVPVAGPMDSWSHRRANQLVGNPPDAATLEVTLRGPRLQCEGGVTVAVVGAVCDLRVDDCPVSSGQPIPIPDGGLLDIGTCRLGTRAYLAVAGGIDVPGVLGSRATHLVCGMGGIEGRALRTGDRLPVGRPPGRPVARPVATGDGPRLPDAECTVRVLPGPQRDWFDDETWAQLLGAPFLVSPASNRMGYRLQGAALPRSRQDELLSEPVAMGAIQVPGGGDPLLLMADCQTMGGYPKIATVIAADLPLAGQLGPGQRVRFAVCTRADALAALIRMERGLLSGEPA